MNTEFTTITLVALGGLLLLIVLMALSDKGNQLLTRSQPAAQLISSIMLVGTVVLLYYQLGHIRDQNELQRNVASKSAIQTLNEVILDKQQKDFLRFVFPKAKEEEARQAMMAFSLMNSLEMLYLTQREHEDVSHDDLKSLISNFTTNVRGMWDDDFATVYHPDFKKIVEEVFKEKQAQQLAD